MLKINSKNDSISLGIFISEQGISLVEIEQKQSQINLLTVENYIGHLQNEKEIISHLQSLLKNKKTTIRKVYTCLPTQHILRKKYEFSSILTEDDILTEINLNPQTYFPGITESLTFDIVLLKFSIEKNKKEYYLFSARTEKLKQLNHILIESGLIPESIEVDHYALLRLMNHYNPISLNSHEANVLLDFTYGPRMILYDNEDVLYDRFLNLSSPNDNLKQLFENNLNNFCSAFPSYSIKEIQIIQSTKDPIEQKLFSYEAIPIHHVKLPKTNDGIETNPITLGLALKKYDY